MPNTKPVCDTPETIGYVMNRAKDADCRVFPVGAISKGLGTREVCDLAALKTPVSGGVLGRWKACRLTLRRL